MFPVPVSRHIKPGFPGFANLLSVKLVRTDVLSALCCSERLWIMPGGRFSGSLVEREWQMTKAESVQILIVDRYTDPLAQQTQ
ncbi:hypothetical protein M758_2G002300 [Ceratodon purpureus]|nr:hypothetical protein M758_2G002300 [Ceratodon purpureus]